MSDVIIHGGCRTVVAEAGIAHDVVFSHQGGRLLTITPDGRLLVGEGLSADDATRAVADKLVEYFGHGYGSRLQTALARAATAEAEAKRMKAQAKAQEDRAKMAEYRLAGIRVELFDARRDLVQLQAEQGEAKP